MKKFKIYAMAIMFMLSVAVMCVGVYSSSLISVAISGELSILPATGVFPVSVQTYIEKQLQHDYGTITNNKFTYSGSISAEAFTGTQPLLLSIKLTNKSNKELGAYFLDTSVSESKAFDADGLVTANGIKVTHEYTDVKVYLASYSYMAKSNASNDYDSVDMTMVFVPKAELASTATISYSFSLYVEEYISNMNAEDLKIGGTWIEQGETIGCVKTMPANLVKIDSSVTVLEDWSFSTAEITDSGIVVPNSWNGNYPNYVVIPSSITRVPSYCFLRTEELYGIFIPKSVTEIGIHAFESVSIDCWILPDSKITIAYAFAYGACKYVFISNSITETGWEPFSRSTTIEYIKIEKGTSDITFNGTLPKIPGKTWYLNGVALPDYTALSISSTTDNIYVCK